MSSLVIFIVAALTAGGFIAMMITVVAKQKIAIKASLKNLDVELEDKKGFVEQISANYKKMVSISKLAETVLQLHDLQENVKAEKGRLAITQTELQTVENRLLELEELERELEASSLEIKEEVEALQKKEAELKDKNQALKGQIASSLQMIDSMMGEIQFSAEVQEQIDLLKHQLVMTENKSEELLINIESSNSQYVDLRKRYDALDIEYAQLYEKFSELDGSDDDDDDDDDF